jgi:hypothetical protein
VKRFNDFREEYKIPLNPPLKRGKVCDIPFERGKVCGIQFLKGEAKVLPFCKGELEGIFKAVWLN